MTLGSDADGDTYYRASNVLTRLAKGTAGQCFQMNGGATAPTWGSCGGASGITIGTTTVTSGTGGRFIYETTGNVVGEISTLTSDGTIVTFSPTVTTGTGATSGLNATANSLTTGDAFTFSSSSVTTGNVVKLASTSTTAGSNTQTVLNVATSGVNGTPTQTTYGIRANNTHTGTTSTNVGLQAAASGGTTNYDLMVGDGTAATAILVSNLSGATDPGITFGNSALTFTMGGTGATFINASSLQLGTSQTLGWASGALGGSNGLILRQAAAANLAFGSTDAASPVAQTLSVQNVVAGTSNTAGATWTFSDSAGTGNAASGGFVFQTHPLGGSGTSQNAAVTALTINSAGRMIVVDGSASVPSIVFSSSTTTGIYQASSGQLGLVGGANERLRINAFGADLGTNSLAGGSGFGVADTRFRRNAAGNWAFGAADTDLNANIVAQKISVQNAAAGGTSDQAGKDFTIAGSQGKGTGAGGSIIFQTAPAGSTGTSVNALVTAVTIGPNGALFPKPFTFSALPTISDGGMVYCSDCAPTSAFVDQTCAGSGTGAMAYRLNGAWKCYN
jgi:hypothetical protein